MRKIEWSARRFLWMAHHGNVRQKIAISFHSLPVSKKKREASALRNTLQHRIFRLFEPPTRTPRFAARVIDERMKRRCLRRYLRLLQYFYKHFAIFVSLARSRSIIRTSSSSSCVLISPRLRWHFDNAPGSLIDRHVTWRSGWLGNSDAVRIIFNFQLHWNGIYIYRSRWTKIWQLSDIIYEDNSHRKYVGKF